MCREVPSQTCYIFNAFTPESEQIIIIDMSNSCKTSERTEHSVTRKVLSRLNIFTVNIRAQNTL